MPENYHGYMLNFPKELPNWSKREYNLHRDLISKLPDAAKTYVSTQHTHAKLVSPDEAYNPLVQTTNQARVGIGTTVPKGPLHVTSSADRVLLKTALSATLLLDTDYTSAASDTGIQFCRSDGSAFVSLGLYRQAATPYYLLYDSYAGNVIYQVTGLGGSGEFQFNPDKVNRDITVAGTTNDMLWIDVSEERMVMRNCAYLQFCSADDEETTTDGAKIWMHTNDDDLYIYNYEEGSVRLRSYSGLYIYHAGSGAQLTIDVTTAGASNPQISFLDGSNAGVDSAWALGMLATLADNSFILTSDADVGSDQQFVWTTTGRYGLNETSPASAIDIDDDAGGTDKGHITLQEINDTNNVTPAADHVAIFARVNGGKTELCAKFNSGNIEQLAIET